MRDQVSTVKSSHRMSEEIDATTPGLGLKLFIETRSSQWDGTSAIKINVSFPKYYRQKTDPGTDVTITSAPTFPRRVRKTLDQ